MVNSFCLRDKGLYIRARERSVVLELNLERKSQGPVEAGEAETAGFLSVLWLPWVTFHHSANPSRKGKETACNSYSQGLNRNKSTEKIKCYQWSQTGKETD